MPSKYTDRHYEDTARILKEAREIVPSNETTISLAEIGRIEERFVDLFTWDNERFDEERFRKAASID